MEMKIQGFEKADSTYNTLDASDLNTVEEMNEKSEAIASDLVTFFNEKGIYVAHSQKMIADFGVVLKGNFKVADLLITHKLEIDGLVDAVLTFDYTNTISIEVYSDDSQKLNSLLTEFQEATGYEIFNTNLNMA